MQLTKKNPNAPDAAAEPLLTYCTNIHAGESWPDIRSSLRTCVPTIRQQLGTPNLGIGLRLGRAGVEALNDRANLEELQDFLNGGYSVFTVNAFPYGPFHGEQVKENVYAPDWSTNERLVYTNTVASVLAELAVVNLSDRNAHNFASISTVPGSFKPWVSGREEAIRQNLVSSVAKLVDIKRASGVEIALALEPEPFCMLETIAETVDWFKDYGFSSRSCEQLAKLCGVSESQAEQLLHTHLGVCYDVCHAAVEYESASDSLRTLKAEGISIPKIQLSSALRVASMTPALAEKLRLFNEEVYLHQVIQRRAGQNSGNDDLVRFLDLPQALESLAAGEGAGSEWRTHFHVPVFLDKLEHFDTTQFFLREVLAILREECLSPHLEIETYTWDVLPEALRTSDISTAITREMQWVMDELQVTAMQ